MIIPRVALAVGTLMLAEPMLALQELPPETLPRALDYSLLGIVMAVVLGLFRLVERLMDRRHANGEVKRVELKNGELRRLEAAMQKMESSLNAATGLLTMVTERQAAAAKQGDEMLASIHRHLDRLERSA